MTEWQPIETAPDDGQTILVFGGRYNKVTPRSADGGFWRYEKKRGATGLPTYWMPLPEPPEK